MVRVIFCGILGLIIGILLAEREDLKAENRLLLSTYEEQRRVIEEYEKLLKVKNDLLDIYKKR